MAQCLLGHRQPNPQLKCAEWRVPSAVMGTPLPVEPLCQSSPLLPSVLSPQPQGPAEAIPRGRASAVDATGMGLPGVKGWMEN